MTELLPALGVPITAHAFNGDRSQLAISPNTHEVHIYVKNNQSWALAHTLTEHDKLVTGIDWAASTNRIVTCSQDRNAYVWNYAPETATWQPTLVLLRLNRSATYVRWSPNEDKFAVASGARTISVCQFDQESDWWVAKHIKKPLRSTVLSLDWHPNSVLLAAGSADGVARVFSAFMKGVDSKPVPTVWGERLPFNTVCGEYASPASGWVHGVAFSPSGDVLAFVSHDASITIVYPSGPDSPPQAVFSIQLPSLPLISLTFTSETSLVAAGHDCQPVVFEGSLQQGWSQTRSLDDHQKRSAAGPGRAGRLHQSEAFNVFRSADSRGVSGSAPAAVAAAGTRLTATGTELLTLHQNTITSVRAYTGQAGDVSQVSTSGVDGRLVVWPVSGGVSGVTQGVGKLGL
ncbi:ARP2/3 actin-organizing complex subunit Sop2 [Microbotryomycetes sp. JL201]|nr:ARP2/3 actin-organizing complex subunit Sop2 [Microbotryomycetes sp. JL201]